MNEIYEIIPIEVSNRHIHLTIEDTEKLFGNGKKLTSFKELSQIGQFAANETVILSNGDKKIEGVRVVGPERKESQIEVSKTDARYLGINAPIRLSGDLENTPGIIVKGLEGEIKLEKGVIVAQRHLHCSLKESEKLGIEHGRDISIKVAGMRSAVLYCVQIRVNSSFRLAIHLDTDEANALDVKSGDFGVILKK